MESDLKSILKHAKNVFGNVSKTYVATGHDTCVSDDEDDAGGDVVGAEDGDPVVVRVSNGELPLCHVQE